MSLGATTPLLSSKFGSWSRSSSRSKKPKFEESPRSGTRRLHVFGELNSCQGFDADNLFVDFGLFTPPCFEVPTADGFKRNTEFRTHCVRAYRPGTWPCQRWLCPTPASKVFEFSFPFAFSLSQLSCFDDSYEDATKKEKAKNTDLRRHQCPALYFEVRSSDCWNVQRVEGYGYCNLPTTAGRQRVAVDVWRPIGKPLDELRRLFVGGGVAFKNKQSIFSKDTRMTTVTHDSGSGQAQRGERQRFDCRMCLTTIETGTINLTLNVAIALPMSSSMTLRKTQISSMATTVPLSLHRYALKPSLSTAVSTTGVFSDSTELRTADESNAVSSDFDSSQKQRGTVQSAATGSAVPRRRRRHKKTTSTLLNSVI